MERDLKSGSVSGSGARSAADAPPTPTRKLGKAIAEENERFLSGQSQSQQQIIRWGWSRGRQHEVPQRRLSINKEETEAGTGA